MITFDQLYSRTAYTSLTGSEIVLLQGSSGTGGGLLSTLKTFFKENFLTSDISDATSLGIQLVKIADLPTAKSLLEIPALPLAPLTLSASTSLDSTHLNRRIFVDTASTLDLPTTATTTDTLHIVNTSVGDVIINSGTSNMVIRTTGGPVTTYTLPANECIRAYLIDATTWFIET